MSRWTDKAEYILLHPQPMAINTEGQQRHGPQGVVRLVCPPLNCISCLEQQTGAHKPLISSSRAFLVFANELVQLLMPPSHTETYKGSFVHEKPEKWLGKEEFWDLYNFVNSLTIKSLSKVSFSFVSSVSWSSLNDRTNIRVLRLVFTYEYFPIY